MTVTMTTAWAFFNYPSIVFDLYHPISTKGEATEERLGNLRRQIIHSDCKAS